MTRLLGPDDSEAIVEFIDNLPQTGKTDGLSSTNLMTMRSMIFYNQLIGVGSPDNKGKLNQLMLVASPGVESPSRSLTIVHYTKEPKFIQTALKIYESILSDNYTKIKINLNSPDVPKTLVDAGFKKEIGFSSGDMHLFVYSFFMGL